MADTSAWKRLLAEPNAVGWIAFLVLVIAIGAGVLYYGAGEEHAATTAKSATGDHASR